MDEARWDDPPVIERILNTKGKIAVVGLSPKPERDSNIVARYLLRHGYDIVPVNPAAEEILGRTSYPSVSAIPGEVEVVDIFRRPDQVEPTVREAIEKGAKAVWLQLGVINEAAARAAREAGLDVVMDRCIKIEHQRRAR